eukprot:4040331-Amphidinium_carterae.1
MQYSSSRTLMFEVVVHFVISTDTYASFIFLHLALPNRLVLDELRSYCRLPPPKNEPDPSG